MATQKFWAVQAHTKEGKALCWKYKNGKQLYFTTDKKSPPPALFSSRTETVKAMRTAKRSRENNCDILFQNTLECKKAVPVKIKVSISN